MKERGHGAVGAHRGQGRNVVQRLALVGLVATAAACSINSKNLLREFNQGLLDSSRDPGYPPARLGTEAAFSAVKPHLIGAYFGQGRSGHVGTWFRALRDDALVDLFVQDATERCQVLSLAGSTSLERETSTERTAFLRAAEDLVVHYPGLELDGPVCDPTGALNEPRAQRLVDAGTMLAGLEFALRDASRLVDEGLVTPGTLRAGACLALDEAGAYVDTRKWTREPDRMVSAMVVKGGGSTGVFSAGVAFRVLGMIDACIRAGKCTLDRHGLDLVSGTSAGALVSTVSDLFHRDICVVPELSTACDPQDARTQTLAAKQGYVTTDPCQCRNDALTMLATYFTCKSQSELYCTYDDFATNLFDDQLSLMRFDGIRALMKRHVDGRSIDDRTELITNSVDFRSGELFSQSDQDPAQTVQNDAIVGPLDVIDGIEASFVLPFIARPVRTLRVHGKLVGGRYLDGGIRSELPVLPLVHRGAERVLVVSSSPSRITPARMQKNALDIATRYIDVSLSAVTEGELPRAELLAHRNERAAHERCLDLVTDPSAAHLDICPAGSCDARALCDLRFEDVCKPAPAVDVPARSRFASLGIYRDDEQTEASTGYSFEPTLLRRVFDGGAETARQRCVEIAELYGVKATPAELQTWCSRRPTIREEACTPDDEVEIRPCPEAGDEPVPGDRCVPYDVDGTRTGESCGAQGAP